jgi:hypothetical protein
MPADSQTARTAAPAMIPVPGLAGNRITFEVPLQPSTRWGIVPETTGTSTRFFIPSLIAFSTAGGTSLALPYPQPTLPFPLPTTTSPAKLNRRPPFTTVAHRRTFTTFSVNSPPALDSLPDAAFVATISLPLCVECLRIPNRPRERHRLTPPPGRDIGRVRDQNRPAIRRRPWPVRQLPCRWLSRHLCCCLTRAQP